MSNDLILPPTELDLESLEVASVDLSQDYWSPTEEGEKKRMYFSGLAERIVLDKDKKEILLKCAMFVEPLADGDSKTIVNGSKKLVATLEDNNIAAGTPVQVTYRGRKKNKTNGNLSDNWTVVTLAVKGAK